MLDIKQIESWYPEHLRVFKRNLLREYFQHKILQFVYDSKYGGKLVFMGGTAIHLIYNNSRFSEDLDFDNRGLGKDDFNGLASLIEKKMGLEGYKVETKTSFKNAFICAIRIADALFESGHKEEKLLIKLDMEPQDFKYAPDSVLINKFDVFLKIDVVPADILLAQKLFAILKRKRALGRDFYDAVFLSGRTGPNFNYLKKKLNIKDAGELKKLLVDRCNKLDFKALAKDVEPYLYDSKDVNRVKMFSDYVKGLNF